jgi:hypothetical protein
MDRLTGSAALAAVLLSLTLTACGGGSADTATTTTPSGGGTPSTAVQGVSTPSSVSVVTAKNAQ